MRILLIEDDRESAKFLAQSLTECGHHVDLAFNGELGLTRAKENSYDAIVIDRMLPKLDGLSAIREMRSSGVRTPALILSALGDIEDRIKGLRAGGDDYLTKPYSFSELLARIESLVRRHGSSEPLSKKIFINYRRKDDPGSAGRLFDRLEASFPPEQLFFDVDSIEPGRDFVEVLNEHVGGCDVVLSIVGPRWLSLLDRAEWSAPGHTSDFVRIEIESALRQQKRIIPVLVSGAEMPNSADLPHAMSSFPRFNAVRLTHERFHADCEGLIRALIGNLKDVETLRHLRGGA